MNTATIKAWSYSARKLFEKCPYAAKLRYLDKLATQPQPEDGPLNRGLKMHQTAEAFVKGEIDALPATFKHLKETYNELRRHYADGNASVEEEWAWNAMLEPVDWMAPDVWLRVKTDAIVFYGDDTAKVIDLKTGKKYGNEVPHMQQGQLYAAAAFLRYPKLQFCTIEFWYPDQQGAKTTKNYTRKKGEELLGRWTLKGILMTTTTEFPPKPNAMNCKYCDYGTVNGTGDCAFAVEPL
jgi:hypothetical protein